MPYKRRRSHVDHIQLENPLPYTSTPIYCAGFKINTVPVQTTTPVQNVIINGKETSTVSGRHGYRFVPKHFFCFLGQNSPTPPTFFVLFD